MNFSQSFKLAIKSLLASKMRAILTMLGIIIGVAAVIIITSLGNGMQTLMNSQFDKLGVNLIQVHAFGRGSDSRDITPDDMLELQQKYPQYLTGVSPSVQVGTTIRYKNDKAFKRTQVTGVSEAFYDVDRNLTLNGYALGKGRFLQYADVLRHASVCVVGSYVEQTAYDGDALGKPLTIGGVQHTIVGVLAQKADSTEGSADDMVYLPYGKALRLSGRGRADTYLFTTAGKTESAIAKSLIEARLFKTYQTSDAYFIMSAAEMMDTMNNMMNVMMIVLVAIAAISLLVGGIGIMNIMLVSVTERTREIGIRKSLGGKRRDIRSQFIIEAGTTSAIGGALGILVGTGLAQAAGIVIGQIIAAQAGPGTTFQATPTLGAVMIAFGVSVAIGVIFGYLPANKAAKLNPIDALRYD